MILEVCQDIVTAIGEPVWIDDGHRDGCYVLVTGASSGIGYETVRLLAERGYNVMATYRHDIGKLKLDKLPGKVVVHKLDMGQIGSVDNLVSACRTKSIRVLVNNASELSVDASNMIESNVVQPIELTNKLLLTQTRMSVINVSSLSFLLAPLDPRSCDISEVYATTKLMITAFTHHLWIQRGIRAISYNPGFVNSNLYRQRQHIDGFTSYISRLRSLGKSPKKVARSLCYHISAMYTDDPFVTMAGYYDQYLLVSNTRENDIMQLMNVGQKKWNSSVH